MYSIRHKTRKAQNRSGTQPCQVCGLPHRLHAHHINGRNIPKANHPSNIANLCPNCHTLVHEGQIILEGHFTTTEGSQLLWHNVTETGLTGQESHPYIIPK
jgi:hypothetical protein